MGDVPDARVVNPAVEILVLPSGEAIVRYLSGIPKAGIRFKSFAQACAYEEVDPGGPGWELVSLYRRYVEIEPAWQRSVSECDRLGQRVAELEEEVRRLSRPVRKVRDG